MMTNQLKSLLTLFLCVFGYETLHAQLNIRDTWNHKASQWYDFIGKSGEKDLNRKFQVDPALLKAAGNFSGKFVLDAGSGTGYLSAKIAKTAKKVIGIDISDEMIKIAKEQYAQENIRFDVGDLSDMRNLVPNQSIDTIISNHVLMDLPDLASTIKEFNRVLKPGGILVFAILHPCFPANNSSYDRGKAIYEWTSSYFENNNVRVPPFSKEFDTDFTVFHRPLSTYINEMLSNSFSLMEFTEPVISEEYREEIPSMLFQRFRHVPISIVMTFKKR